MPHMSHRMHISATIWHVTGISNNTEHMKPTNGEQMRNCTKAFFISSSVKNK